MIIHDHFDGSAHCVECGNKPCELRGDDRAVTDIVRWTLEFADSVHKGWMWGFQKDALSRILGGPATLEHFQTRARETGYKSRPAGPEVRG